MAKANPVSASVSIDGCPRIDSFLLHRRGALIDGAVTRWEWPLPLIGTTTVNARTKGHRLFLSVNGGPEVAYGVVRRSGTTGSSYPFLACSCEGSGQLYPSTRYLYIKDDRVACRACHKLAWPCRTTPRSKVNVMQRRLRRARANLVAIEMELLRLRRESGLKSV